MIRGIYSHYLRTKRTSVRILILLCPLIYSLLLSLYFNYNTFIQKDGVYAYFDLFGVISIFCFSFFVPLVYKPDASANGFANELRFAINRSKNLIYKFILIALLYAFILILGTFIFYICMNLLGIWNTSFNDSITFMVIVYITSIHVIPIYQYVYLRFNSSISIMTGCFLSLSSLLLGTTGLGSFIWTFTPCTYGLRLLNGYYNRSMSATYIYLFLIFTIIFTVILLAIVCAWYNKWNGREIMEDTE